MPISPGGRRTRAASLELFRDHGWQAREIFASDAFDHLKRELLLVRFAQMLGLDPSTECSWIEECALPEPVESREHSVWRVRRQNVLSTRKAGARASG